jgi:hypothetical protein
MSKEWGSLSLAAKIELVWVPRNVTPAEAGVQIPPMAGLDSELHLDDEQGLCLTLSAACYTG